MRRPESWATFIGFLAGRQATIHAQIKDWAVDNWAGQYQLATGRQMPAPGDGYQVVEPGVNKWACSVSVAFRATRGELMSAHGYSALPWEVEIKDGTGGQLMIYSEPVMWDLFDCGFALGTRQDVGAVRDYLAPALYPHFDKGLALAGD